MGRSVVFKWMKRSAITVVSASVLFTAMVGVAHTSVGRPLRPILGFLGAHGVSAGTACPLGYDVASSPEAREAARIQFAASHRGAAVAGARFALGFTLDVTTESDVQGWAHAHQVTCERTSKPSHPDVECNDLPARAFGGSGPAKRTRWMNFEPKGTLVSLVVIGKDPSVNEITREYGDTQSRLTASAGPIFEADQDGSPEMLSRGLLRQSHAEFRFRDYYVLLRQTNMGNEGFIVTEEYRSLPL